MFKETVTVNYEYTDNAYKALQWLNGLPDVFASDFEAASKYTLEEKEVLKFRLSQTKDKERTIWLNQQIESDGLSHPSLTVITHLSVAWSDRDSYVIVCSNQKLRDIVYNFLVTTDKVQIWHNALFDFRHIIYHTGVIPKNYKDTMLLAKSILNNADSFKDRVGLKELMGWKYGDWALSKDDDYTLENMWNPRMLKYAATDSCACISLYNDIQEDLNEWQI